MVYDGKIPDTRGLSLKSKNYTVWFLKNQPEKKEELKHERIGLLIHYWDTKA